MTPDDVRPTDIIVDNTILASVAACSTQAALRHVLHLTTTADAAPLIAGQYAHEVLAWWLLGVEPAAALRRLDGYRRWAQGKVAADDKLAPGNVHRILEHWMAMRPLATWPLLVESGQVEVPLVGVLGVLEAGKPVLPREDHDGEPRVVMVALLDAIGRRRTGGHYSIDHKTTSNVNDYFKDSQEDSSQFTGQLWLAAENGHTLHGVYVNAVEFWTVPSSSRACKTHGSTYAECGLKHLKHFLFPVTRSTHEIATWPITARQLTRKFLRLRARVASIEDVRTLPMEGRFVRACRNCSFREWCRRGRPASMAQEFVREEWNPLVRAAEMAASVAAVRGTPGAPGVKGAKKKGTKHVMWNAEEGRNRGKK
jgi:hypothetical protein